MTDQETREKASEANQAPIANEKAFNAPPATVTFCLILVAVFLLYHLCGGEGRKAILDNGAFIPAAFVGLFDGDDFSFVVLLSLVTHSLLHFNFIHLVLNAGFLLAFGSVVEREYGLAGFIVIFLCAAAAGAFAQTLAHGAVWIHMIGASGAVYGMMSATIYLMLTSNMEHRLRRSLFLAAALMILNLIIGVLSNSTPIFSHRIAWQAHIGGFLAGFLLAILLSRFQKSKAHQ